MSQERDNIMPAGGQAEAVGEDSTSPAQGATKGEPSGAAERSPWLIPYRWQPGQSGNPKGWPRGAGSPRSRQTLPAELEAG